MWYRSALQALPVLLLLAAPGFAQTPSPAAPDPSTLVRVYLDCSACDMTFLRQEIHYLDFVVDPHDSEVHVLVTVRRTGAGGNEYTIKYIGQERFAGDDRTLLYASSPTDTEDEERRGFARVFGLGLTPYLVESAAMDSLELVYDGDRDSQSVESGGDPWDSWIFRLSGSVQMDAETSSSSHRYRSSVSANRTTEAWKTSFFLNSNVQTDVFTLSDGSLLHSRSDNWRARQLVVRSIGPDHWAAAVRAEIGASTSTNSNLDSRTGSGLEYNFFPYSESSNRSMILQYTLGYDYFDYLEPTIYGKLNETLFDERLLYSLAFRQPWGSSLVNVEGSHYLEDPSKFRVTVDGHVDVRLFRGLMLNLDGSVASVHDQLYLPAGGATDDEILLRIRELQTSFTYSLRIGLSYQFGSIFNNVVNPRFDAR